MPSTSEQLVRRLVELNEVTERVRAVLLRYHEASSRVATLVDQGSDLVATLQSLGGPIQRSEVTEALGEFEAARHRVRLAMAALAKDQGSTMSDLGRALGISRQLASRLAAEVENADT